jgi:hypothetical protein
MRSRLKFAICSIRKWSCSRIARPIRRSTSARSSGRVRPSPWSRTSRSSSIPCLRHGLPEQGYPRRPSLSQDNEEPQVPGGGALGFPKRWSGARCGGGGGTGPAGARSTRPTPTEAWTRPLVGPTSRTGHHRERHHRRTAATFELGVVAAVVAPSAVITAVSSECETSEEHRTDDEHYSGHDRDPRGGLIEPVGSMSARRLGVHRRRGRGRGQGGDGSGGGLVDPLWCFGHTSIMRAVVIARSR